MVLGVLARIVDLDHAVETLGVAVKGVGLEMQVLQHRDHGKVSQAHGQTDQADQGVNLSPFSDSAKQS